MNCPHCNVHVDEHEAGRRMDAWVAEVVMGKVPCTEWRIVDFHIAHDAVAPTTKCM